MRIFGLSTAALVLMSPVLLAQVPRTAPAAPAAPANARLQQHLQAWEKVMVNVTTLAAQMERIEIDKTFKTTKTYSGYAQYKKFVGDKEPVEKFMLEFRPKDKPKVISEKIVSTGTYMFEFHPHQKEIRYRTIPKRQKGQESNFLSFLLGMKAQQAQRRYHMTLVKEDAHYVYISVQPRTEKDKADFERARVALSKKTYLPAQLWFVSPNNSETTWNIPKIRSGVELEDKYFDKPALPPGWKLQAAVTPTAPTKPKPRVTRSSGTP